MTNAFLGGREVTVLFLSDRSSNFNPLQSFQTCELRGVVWLLQGTHEFSWPHGGNCPQKWAGATRWVLVSKPAEET